MKTLYWILAVALLALGCSQPSSGGPQPTPSTSAVAPQSSCVVTRYASKVDMDAEKNGACIAAGDYPNATQSTLFGDFYVVHGAVTYDNSGIQIQRIVFVASAAITPASFDTDCATRSSRARSAYSYAARPGGVHGRQVQGLRRRQADARRYDATDHPAIVDRAELVHRSGKLGDVRFRHELRYRGDVHGRLFRIDMSEWHRAARHVR